MNVMSLAEGPGLSCTRQRQRLPSDVRVRQILDAAQLEFSERGFAAARMDDIARRSGLSKGGLYAHFASKDEVFEALLTRSLRLPDLGDPPPLQAGTTAREVAQWLVERLHASLSHPDTLATFRLLMAEGERVPHLIDAWHRQLIEPHLALLRETLGRAGTWLGSRSILLHEPWLALAPVVHLMVMQLIFGRAQPQRLEAREAHVALLIELLSPRG